ncbi:MAG: TlpA family protein disulfide reductase [Steroidobacteraceae bacterium]|jgi:peroxiredoxin
MNRSLRAMAASGALALLSCSFGFADSLGGAAPDFERPDLAGNVIHLAAFRGKVVLLNFWASWCAPCLKELPRFSAWQRDYGVEGLQILGVSMDDDAAPVRRLLAKHPLAYPILMGDAKLGEAFGGVLGLPCSYLIDTEGRIVARFRGEGDLKQIEAQIKALLPGLHGLRGPATFN